MRDPGLCRLLLKLLWLMAFRMEVVVGIETSKAPRLGIALGALWLLWLIAMRCSHQPFSSLAPGHVG